MGTNYPLEKVAGMATHPGPPATVPGMPGGATATEGSAMKTAAEDAFNAGAAEQARLSGCKFVAHAKFASPEVRQSNEKSKAL